MSLQDDITSTILQLQTAWNANDGRAFAAPFTDDAEFTVFDGWQLSGREAIAKDHEHAFNTVRRGTTSTWTVERVKSYGDVAAMAWVNVIVHNVPTPNGPTEMRTVPRVLLQRDSSGWRIAALINMVYRPIGDAHHLDNR